MAIVSTDTLKGYFNTGDRPTESNFVDLIDTLSQGGSPTVIDSITQELTFGSNQVMGIDDRDVQNGNYSFTLAASGNTAGYVIQVYVQANGTGTFTFSSDFVILNSSITSGGTLTADTTYLISFLYDGDKVLVNVVETNASALDVTAPTLSSATIEAATDSVLDLVFDEAVTITTAGWSISTDGAALSISAVASGSGTTTPKFTLSRSILSSETITISYDSTTGNTVDGSGNELATFNNTSVTNNAGYDTDAEAIFTQMGVVGTEPDAARKTLINSMVVGLKSDGVWAELVSLQVYHAHEQSAALVDWKSPGGNAASLVGSPTFTVDTQITTNGSTQAIDTGVTPSTDLSTNDFSTGIYVKGTFTAISGVYGLFGCTMTAPSVSAIKMLWNTSGSKYQGNINDATTLASGGSSTKALDTLYSAIRSGATARQFKIDNTTYASDSQASLSLPDVNIYLGCDNHETNGLQTFTNIGLSAFYAGTSSVNQANFKSRLETYIAGL